MPIAITFFFFSIAPDCVYFILKALHLVSLILEHKFMVVIMPHPTIGEISFFLIMEKEQVPRESSEIAYSRNRMKIQQANKAFSYWGRLPIELQRGHRSSQQIYLHFVWKLLKKDNVLWDLKKLENMQSNEAWQMFEKWKSCFEMKSLPNFLCTIQ